MVTPKQKKLREAMEDVFGTVQASVRSIDVMEPNLPDRGADEDGAYFHHEIIIKVVLDSRLPNTPRPAALEPSSRPGL